jgi:stage III sporulation protein AA
MAQHTSGTEKLSGQIMPYMITELRGPMSHLTPLNWQSLEEIRFRVNQPCAVRLNEGSFWLGANGITRNKQAGLIISPNMLSRLVSLFSQSSLYALEDELRQGYITLAGGHRLGLVGQGVMVGGSLKTVKNISGLNLRLARAVEGAADFLIPYLVLADASPAQTLLISPPGGGKTTVLRDIVRKLSNAEPPFLKGYDVGLADERSEISGAVNGLPQLDVGGRTDTFCGCKKSESMMLLIRSMSPQVLATDEIGRAEDVYALQEALNTGIKVIATAHGAGLAELLARPVLGELIEKGFFQRLIIFKRIGGKSVLTAVYDEKCRNIMEAKANA